jgi:hypothetical protein
MAQREQGGKMDEVVVGNKEGKDVRGLEKEVKEWDRIIVGYLSVFAVWMWESPKVVNEFLEEGTNIQMVSETTWCSSQ